MQKRKGADKQKKGSAKKLKATQQLAELRELVFDPASQIGVGVDPGVTQAVSAASGVWDERSGQLVTDQLVTDELVADQLTRWKLTKDQVKHASGLNNSRCDIERWLAPIKPHLQHLAAASSASTSLEANLKHITVTLATWDAVWEVYLDPKWAGQRLRLYGAQDRALQQFFRKLEEDMAEVSMEHHWHAKHLVVFSGAASIDTRGGWGADAVLRACCKVLCRPRGSDQRRGSVVLVDEHRTHPVTPRKPPQAPCSSQAATPAAASGPGPSTPPPAKRSKHTKAEQGKAAKAKPAPQPGRWLDRDCNAAFSMQRIGESKWRPLELCYGARQATQGPGAAATVYNQLQRRLVRPGKRRHPVLLPIFADPSNQALLRFVKLYAKAARARLNWSDEEAQLYIKMVCGYGINAQSSELQSATLDKAYVADLIEEADKHRGLLGMKKQGSLQDTLPHAPCGACVQKLTKGQVKHASSLNNSRRDTKRWLAPIKPHLQHLAAASSVGTSLESNLEHNTVTLVTWDAVWEVYLNPRWARQRLRLYGAQDRALEQFFKKLEVDMAEMSMERHGHAKQLVVFFGAAGIGTRGGWGADAVLRACCKVLCRPRGTDQRRGKVVLVDEHRTTRVGSAVNGKQPCEEELDHEQPTRPADWKPPAGQSQQRDLPERGLMWCPVVAPRKPPQAPRNSEEATQPAASEPGPRAKRAVGKNWAGPTNTAKLTARFAQQVFGWFWTLRGTGGGRLAGVTDREGMPAIGECEGIQGPSESALHANIKVQYCSKRLSKLVLMALAAGYQFLDEGPHVKVYLPLEGVGAKCSRQCPADAEAGEGLQPVSWELGVRQVSLKVRGYKEGRTLLFEVKRLGGDIVPEACTFKPMITRITIAIIVASK
ncbi:hypothetical protein QJQ45_013586 [Haematococcus lacustris]|nr:hypothetical protein QJQ45_013586 [Haematococcus lacustris]